MLPTLFCHQHVPRHETLRWYPRRRYWWWVHWHDFLRSTLKYFTWFVSVSNAVLILTFVSFVSLSFDYDDIKTRYTHPWCSHEDDFVYILRRKKRSIAFWCPVLNANFMSLYEREECLAQDKIFSSWLLIKILMIMIRIFLEFLSLQGESHLDFLHFVAANIWL